MAGPAQVARSFFNGGCFAAPDEPAKVARESGWLVSGLSERRLVFAMKSVRDRCLWLSVFGLFAVEGVAPRT